MNIAETAIRNQAVTWVLTVAVIAGGMWAYSKLGRLEDPEFTIKDAQVITRYPGASAMQVADEVTDEIETAVQQMGQLDRVKSLSQPGLSIVRVTMKDKYDKKSLPQVWDELRRKVNDAQSKLPPGAQTSVVNDDFGDVFGVFLAVFGDGFTWAELKDYVDLLRRELLLCQDVAKVSLYGDQQEVVYVEISRQKIAALGIAPNQVYASLAGANLVTPSGSVDVDTLRIRIEPTGEFKSVEEIGNVLLRTDKSSKLYLRDIADIREGYADPPTTIMRFNGRAAIGVGISTVEGGNAVTMGNAVQARLLELQEQTPIGMEVGVISMQSASVTASVNGFIVNLVEAVLIVIGVLMIAMGLRSGLIIGVILVLTVAATFLGMYLRGILLERISLGALIIALGMLVDNAIVIVEGILVNIQRGMERIEAAASIVKQTMWPLLGATLIAILAFAAIGASQDSTGEYCRSLFLVILISLLASWVTAVTVTPLFGVKFLRAKVASGQTDPYGGVFFSGYRWLLRKCLQFRWVTLIIMALLLVTAVWGFGFIKTSFFPDSTRPQFMIHFWLPQGTDIRQTEAELAKAEKQLGRYQEITDVTGFVGRGALRFLLTYTPEDVNSAYGMLLVSVRDYRQIDSLIQRLQKDFQEYPDALIFSRRFILGPGEPGKIQARFRGGDPRVLRGIESQAMSIMRSHPMAVDVLSDWRQRVPLAVPLIAESQAREVGLERSAIATRLETAFSGLQIGIYRKRDKLLPIVTWPPETERSDIDNINDVQIWSPTAKQTIPLRQVILAMETRSNDETVWRRNRLPTLTVKCDPKEGYQASETFEQLRPKIEAIPLPPSYTLEWGGEYEDSNKAQAALAGKIPVVLIMMVLILVVLFNSVRVPLAIFLTVPLAIIGVTAGLLLFRQPFGFMAILGFLSLAGLQIKNAVVMADEFRAQISSGKDPFKSVVDSGVSRLRPVSMGALTTVLGMIPLVTDAFFVSMAVTIMMGLIFATVLTTLVFPVIYAVVFQIRPR
ncbi:MAG: efflux RND transporter permease subunit [Planctomycetaceae bacterium]|nr:efflux RND transporter permease subunit [Planctomycetaceae bacterium]